MFPSSSALKREPELRDNQALAFHAGSAAPNFLNASGTLRPPKRSQPDQSPNSIVKRRRDSNPEIEKKLSDLQGQAAPVPKNSFNDLPNEILEKIIGEAGAVRNYESYETLAAIGATNKHLANLVSNNRKFRALRLDCKSTKQNCDGFLRAAENYDFVEEKYDFGKMVKYNDNIRGDIPLINPKIFNKQLDHIFEYELADFSNSGPYDGVYTNLIQSISTNLRDLSPAQISNHLIGCLDDSETMRDMAPSLLPDISMFSENERVKIHQVFIRLKQNVGWRLPEAFMDLRGVPQTILSETISVMQSYANDLDNRANLVASIATLNDVDRDQHMENLQQRIGPDIFSPDLLCLAMHNALENGSAAAVIGVAKIIIAQQLSEESVAYCLGAKYYNNPGLYEALNRGQASGITAYAGVILAAELPNDIIVKFLEAKNENGIPGLHTALENGHAPTVTAYIEEIEAAGLPNDIIAKLLEAKDNNGVSGLHAALKNGHTTTVTAYIEATRAAGLPNDIIITLLEAKDDSGVPGLYAAIKNGHVITVAAYVEAISAARLPDDKTIMLLEAKKLLEDDVASSDDAETTSDEDIAEVPLLHEMLRDGEASKVTTYVEAILAAGLPNSIVIQLLEAKDDTNVPGIHAARDNGHDTAMTAYVDAIRAARLPDEFVVKLLRSIYGPSQETLPAT